ncbi:hypothetical protein F4808DRAFT_424498 [Astrocystis sublimbata]|nr:hypothetical protein F4808DRAFT_424498 [Astrocystis sublimbata]
MYHGRAVSLTRPRSSHQVLHHLCPQPLTRLSPAWRIAARAMATSGETSTVKKRAVAGSFIFKIPNGDDRQAKVALFRRSSEVRTYQHKLAPCSGSVEKEDANPLATALREIKEETTLPASSLELLRVGKPYSFVDESIGREWNINPFAFRLKDVSEGGKGEEGITLDWEHEGIEWFDPMQVSGSDEFGGVPRLVDSLRRVWPEYDLGSAAGRALTEGLQNLRDDHEHGARELAGSAVATLREVVNQLALSHPIDKSWWSNVRMAAWHLCQSRPSMGAAITSALIKALGAIKSVYHANTTAEEKVKQIADVLDQQVAQRSCMTDRVCESFTKHLRQTMTRDGEQKKTVSVLTLSCSSTISSSLMRATSAIGVALDLRILESRPLYEGVTLASKILSDTSQSPRTNVAIYSDASASLAARGVDVVLLGADRISEDGDVSNKIGSLPAVLAARYVNPNVAVLVLSDTEKIAGPGSMEEHSHEENNAAEMTQAWKGVVKGADEVEDALSLGDSRLAVKNAYFEWVPADLIDAYATEEGLWSTGQIQQKSKLVGDEFEQFFADL